MLTAAVQCLLEAIRTGKFQEVSKHLLPAVALLPEPDAKNISFLARYIGNADEPLERPAPIERTGATALAGLVVAMALDTSPGLIDALFGDQSPIPGTALTPLGGGLVHDLLYAKSKSEVVPLVQHFIDTFTHEDAPPGSDSLLDTLRGAMAELKQFDITAAGVRLR